MLIKQICFRYIFILIAILGLGLTKCLQMTAFVCETRGLSKNMQRDQALSKFLRLMIENAPFFFLLFFNKNTSLFLINPKLLGGPASGSLKITAFSYIQPSEPFLDLLTPASFTRKMRVLSQKCDACEILDLSAVT